MDFLIGGCAAVCAGFFTNPLEVLKVRLQLQGELCGKGEHYIYYRNVFHAAYVVVKHDGIRGLQQGLMPALWVQFLSNGTRLGTHHYFSSGGFTKDENGNVVFIRRFCLSGLAGTLGQLVSTPMHLIKTHRMAKSAKEIAVGFQRENQGSWKALCSIFTKCGIKGLFRGGLASIPRAFVASSSQLSAFEYSKEWFDSHGSFKNSPMMTSFLASMVAGIAISVTVTPFDLILTRLYNQGVDPVGKGITYTGFIDCISKIYKIEGLSAFYKGLGPMYFRLGPHTVLTLVFWDKFKMFHEERNKHI